MALPSPPFVLLDDASEGASSPARLFADPVAVIEARCSADVLPGLDRLRAAGDAGLHAAGFLSYEAGHALDPKLGPLARDTAEHEPPLLWFGLFRAPRLVAPAEVPRLLGDAPARAAAPRPLIGFDAYTAAFSRAAALIAAGEIYQVNLAFPTEVPLAGPPAAAFRAIRARARAPFSALVATGDHWLLSFSPELFFEIAGGRVRTRPMKGTAARSADPASDVAAARALAADPKQRAENLMIVDLLRNDLARSTIPGSIRVPRLFEVESYPTVHQLTSTVEGRLRSGTGPVDLLRAIFPCGSVTGAPKLRAMEAIAELEPTPRGPYTGAIGALGPRGAARFNVAIRTLTLPDGGPTARLGLGSGVVADSRAEEEWRECLAKGAFVTGQLAV